MATTQQIKDYINDTFSGDELQGYKAALKELCNGLFGEEQNGDGQQGDNEQDNKLPPLPIPQRRSKQDQDQKNNKQNNTDNQNQSQSDSENNNSEEQQEEQTDNPQEKQLNKLPELSQQQIEEIADRIDKARDKALDVIEDDYNQLNSQQQQELQDAMDAAEKAQKAIESAEDKEAAINAAKEAKKAANELEKTLRGTGRLQQIRQFWDNENNQTSSKNDNQVRKQDKELQRQIDQIKNKAKDNANKKTDSSNLPKLSIKQITQKIVKALQNEYAKTTTTSWTRLNSKAASRGLIKPGKYKSNQSDQIPTVAFYFDASGSWRGDATKIKLENALENELKKISVEQNPQNGIISLEVYYFADYTAVSTDSCGWGNSDAPVADGAPGCIVNRRPDNIIICTDSDPRVNTAYTAKGFVWLVFAEDINKSLIQNVKGHKGTTAIMLAQ